MLLCASHLHYIVQSNGKGNMAERTIVCSVYGYRLWQVSLGYILCKCCLQMCVSANVSLCAHPPSVHSRLIAIPSGRQECARLLRDICTFIRLY